MATNQDLELLISANAAGVKTGMNDAQKAVQDASSTMQASTEKLASTTKSAMDSLLESFRNMTQGVKKALGETAGDTDVHAQKIGAAMNGAVSSMEGQMKGLSNAVGFISKNFAALAAMVAGIGIFKDGINASKEFTGEAVKLSKAFNMSATEAASLNVALGDIYTDVDTVVGASQQLSRQLRQNEDGLKKMGLQTRDSSGEYRNMKDLMLDAVKVLGSYKEGTDRTLAGQVLFGKGASEVTALMRLNNEVLEEAKKKQEALGLTVSVDNVNAAKAYKAAMNDVSDVMLALKKTIGDAVMPVFTKLGEWLSTTGPAAVVILRGAIGGLAATFWYVKNGVTVLWETINAMVVSVAEPIRALGTAIYKALTGDWKGAKEELSGIGSVISSSWKQGLDEMEKSSEETNRKVKALFLQGEDAKKTDNSNKKSFVDPGDGTKKPESQMKSLEAELAERKVAYQEEQRQQGSFREFSKQMELAYWEEKLALVAKGSQDEKTIRLKIAQEKLAIDRSAFDAELARLKENAAEFSKNAEAKLVVLEQYSEKVRKAFGEESKEYADAQKQIVMTKRQAVEQMQAIDDAHQQVTSARLQSEVDLDEAVFQAKQQMSAMSHQEILAAEIDFENRRYQIQSDAIQQSLKLVDPKLDPVLYQQKLSQIEQLQIQHNAKVQQMTVKANAEMQLDWKSSFDSLESGFGRMITTIGNGTSRIANGFRTLALSTGDAMIGMVGKWAAVWFVDQVKTIAGFGARSSAATTSAAVTTAATTKAATAQTAASTTAAGAISAAFAESAASSALAFKLMAAAIIPAMAGVAGASGVASFAAAPFPIDMGAPAFGAEMAGVALSFAPLASASKGFDIPAGVNPVTQLHEKEMVLPAKHAEVIRNMADNGGQAGGNVTVNIQAVDAHSVKRLFESNGHALAAVMKKQVRNFNY